MGSDFIAGGQVAKNSDIDSAVNPGWRTAKAHVSFTLDTFFAVDVLLIRRTPSFLQLVIGNAIPEEGTIDEVHTAEEMFQTVQLPIIAPIQGPVPAAYSNEADAFEVNWQSVFYGANYGRLSSIKAKYDPSDLFIVTTGVGSERWDSYGLCRV
jgi:hypothetical protein